MSQAVGFTFQGDVFAGGSLAFSAAGKLLKSLSDGGVDIYAVGALIELGKCISISQHQEGIVSRSMQKRSLTRHGYLAKALSIGWGHNDAAYELSRTRGGCAALLAMNAFNAGTTGFVAAQGLQELLRLNGCEENYLPSVDVIKNVVSFMSPIMKDCGFHSVLETIRLSALVELSKHLSVPAFEDMHRSLISGISYPSQWANAVHQLSLTSRLGESIYMHTKSRAIWMAAFATFILGMDCTLVYNANVLWRAAGSRGAVTLQVGDLNDTPTGFSNTFRLRPRRENEISDGGFGPMCLLEDALSTALLEMFYVSDKCQQIIQLAIVRMLSCLATVPSSSIAARNQMSGFPYKWPFHRLDKTIVSVCQRLKIQPTHLEAEVVQALALGFDDINRSEVSWWDNILSEDDVSEFCKFCYCAAHSPKRSKRSDSCLLTVVEDLLCGFAATALALIPCVIHATTVRVRSRVISGKQKTTWSKGIKDLLLQKAPSLNLSMHLAHLRALLHGKYEEPDLSNNAIASSARDTTVAVRALLEEEAFCDDGKYLAIYSGRLSFQGCLRETVEEEYSSSSARFVEMMKPHTVASGSQFRHTNTEFAQPLNSVCNVYIKPSIFEARFYLIPFGTTLVLGTDMAGPQIDASGNTLIGNDYLTVRITQCIKSLLQSTIGKKCEHPKEASFFIPGNDTFSKFQAGVNHPSAAPSSCTFIGPHGNRSRQLLACPSNMEHSSNLNDIPFDKKLLVLQGDSCLSCAFELAKYKFLHPYQARGYDRAIIICS